MQQLKMRMIINDYSEPKLPEGFSLRVADDDSMSDSVETVCLMVKE